MLKNFLMWYLGVRNKIDEHGFKKTYVPVPLDLSRRAGLTGMFLLALSYFLINLTFYKLNGMDSRSDTNQTQSKNQRDDTFSPKKFELKYAVRPDRTSPEILDLLNIKIYGPMRDEQVLSAHITYPEEAPQMLGIRLKEDMDRIAKIEPIPYVEFESTITRKNNSCTLELKNHKTGETIIRHTLLFVRVDGKVTFVQQN